MRGGLGAYLESGKTFGIPQLALWANRLSANNFDGQTLVTEGTPGVRLDAGGLPIHGLLSGCPDWKITRSDVVTDGPGAGVHLSADLDFAATRP